MTRSSTGLGGGSGEAAHAEGDEVAVEVDGGGVLTHGAWHSRSDAVARGLAARGVGAGDRVGLLFDSRRWADFAIAHRGARRAGAVAVLLSPGAAPGDLGRDLADAGLRGLICPPDLAPPGGSQGWVADVAALAAGGGPPGPPGPPPAAGPTADVVYPLAPLAPSRPSVHGHAAPAGPVVDGWFVHAWAPGSPGGRHALGLMRPGTPTRVLALARFDADRLCALVEERRAAGCGLTAPLAAALVASGAPARFDLASVAHVVLSGPPSAGTDAAVRTAFPRAAVLVLDGVASADAGGDAVAVSQEGMIWHEQFAAGSFNLPCLARRYEGPLDVAALSWALSELVRRHQPLRSTFAVVAGEACQVVHAAGAAPLATTDLSDVGPDERDQAVADVLADATSRPFDLATGPLFEPRLLRLAPDDHVLVVRLHHTVFDDWSVDVFRRELSAFYAARLEGAPSPLLEPATTFGDVARRQRQRLAGERGDAELAWWRRELSGAPVVVQLPIGDDGDGVGDGVGDGDLSPGEPLRLDLSPELVAALRALAPRLRATPFMTALAAFSLLVSRVTGQDDLVVATVVAHRNTSDVEPLIGCFTKKVPVRLRVGGDPTFAELVARTRSALLGALAHQDVGFEASVHEGLGAAAADHGVAPHVAIVFQGEAPRLATLALPGLRTGPYEGRSGARRERHFTASRDGAGAGGEGGRAWGDGAYLGTFLILSLLETPGAIALVARGVFSVPATRRLLADFETMLAAVVADPSRRASDLDVRPVPGPTMGDDALDVRGLRVSRAGLEAALARAPGVADVALGVRAGDVDGGPRLTAYVVAGPGPAPTLAGLRSALWAERPGAPWPADAVAVDAIVRRPDGSADVDALPCPDRAPVDAGATAVGLAAIWAETSGRPVTLATSYWQDFSFLKALAVAREAGFVIPDDLVVRCRTPATLAAAVDATHASPSV